MELPLERYLELLNEFETLRKEKKELYDVNRKKYDELSYYQILLGEDTSSRFRDSYLQILEAFVTRNINGEEFAQQYGCLKREIFEAITTREENVKNRMDLQLNLNSRGFSEIESCLETMVDQFDPTLKGYTSNDYNVSEDAMREFCRDGAIPFIQDYCETLGDGIIMRQHFIGETISDNNFISLILSKTAFFNCTFNSLFFEKAVFFDCIFDKCTFNQIELQATGVENCTFTNCIIINSEIQNIDVEETRLINSRLKNTILTDGFMDSCQFHDSSFDDITSYNSVIIDSQVSKFDVCIELKNTFNFESILHLVNSMPKPL